MIGHIGFSYIGLVFLLLLILPNILFAKRMPREYTSANESRFLRCLERLGEALTSACLLLFSDFNPKSFSPWIVWLFAAALSMLLYEIWWIRYFRSTRSLADFYKHFLGIPVPGAVFPAIAFFLLSIYGRVIWLLLADVFFAIGHIGIHLQHSKEVQKDI